MKNMNLFSIAEACEGRLCGLEQTDDAARAEIRGREASCVVIDSRKIEANGIFVATRGEKVDGHTFIPNVAARGALGVVCEQPPENAAIPYILVEDSFKALKKIAEYYRKQLKIQVVGITGSVGKTSTKELIAEVLSTKYRVLKTQGNFNNEIVLPLTVLSIRPEHEIAVLEMGISDFGEMHRLSKIARPDICVMTNIGQSHLETLGTREGILKAKSEIFDFMNPEGCVFVNGDDDLLRLIRKKGNYEPVHFGLDPSNEIYASDVKNSGLSGTHVTVHAKLENSPMKVFPLEIPLPGEHMILNALAAAGIALQLGLSTEEIQRGVAETEMVSGRSNVLALPSYTLIDDCYNANPASMRAALNLLASAAGRKVAVLGDMFELGKREKQLHKEIGDYVGEKGIDVLLCTGDLSKNIYEGALNRERDDGKKVKAYYFESREDMTKKLPALLQKGDTILVKASHRMEFEKVVEFLKKM